jgi:hypothetical protein
MDVIAQFKNREIAKVIDPSGWFDVIDPHGDFP